MNTYNKLYKSWTIIIQYIQARITMCNEFGIMLELTTLHDLYVRKTQVCMFRIPPPPPPPPPKKKKKKKKKKTYDNRQDIKNSQ